MKTHQRLEMKVVSVISNYMKLQVNPEAWKIDPLSSHLDNVTVETDTEKESILQEIKDSPFYFLKRIVRVPLRQYGNIDFHKEYHDIRAISDPIIINKNVFDLVWFTKNNVDHVLYSPRQTYKTTGTIAALIYKMIVTPSGKLDITFIGRDAARTLLLCDEFIDIFKLLPVFIQDYITRAHFNNSDNIGEFIRRQAMESSRIAVAVNEKDPLTIKSSINNFLCDDFEHHPNAQRLLTALEPSGVPKLDDHQRTLCMVSTYYDDSKFFTDGWFNNGVPMNNKLYDTDELFKIKMMGLHVTSKNTFDMMGYTKEEVDVIRRELSDSNPNVIKREIDNVRAPLSTSFTNVPIYIDEKSPAYHTIKNTHIGSGSNSYNVISKITGGYAGRSIDTTNWYDSAPIEFVKLYQSLAMEIQLNLKRELSNDEILQILRIVYSPDAISVINNLESKLRK